jgi:hypothetical protein
MRHALVSWLLLSSSAVLSCHAPTARKPQLQSPRPAAAQCGSAPRAQTQRCSGFNPRGFVEADATFFFANEDEAAELHPYSVSVDVRAVAEPEITTLQFERSEALRFTLPRLECFSVTNIEVDALAKVLDPSGSSKLQPVLYAPESCSTVWRIPRAFVTRLLRERNTSSLGERWRREILATPNPYTIDTEPELEPIRRHPTAWTTIVTELQRFVCQWAGGSRELYLSVECGV